jgi:hypothetical protein
VDLVVITFGQGLHVWWFIGEYNGKYDTLTLVVIAGFSGGYPDPQGVHPPVRLLVRPTKWWAHREGCWFRRLGFGTWSWSTILRNEAVRLAERFRIVLVGSH